METYTYPQLEGLEPVLRKTDYFIVGELHGVEENAKVMETLLSLAVATARPVVIAFEWLLAPHELEAVRSYVSGVSDTLVAPPFFSKSDGRVTAAHLSLLDRARTLNQEQAGAVEIAVFDSNASTYKQDMLRNLREAKGSEECVVLVETGVVHARELPAALSKSHEVYAAFLSYESGEAFIDGNKYDVADSYEQQRGPEKDFDAVIVISRATAAEPERILTELNKLYKV